MENECPQPLSLIGLFPGTLPNYMDLANGRITTSVGTTYGQAQAITQHRRQVLQAAYHSHPERFVHGVPHPPSVPTEVWITPPIVTTSIQYPLDE